VTERLADVVGQVEDAVLAAGACEPGAAERLASLRMLISMQLEAGALAGDEVDDDEATLLRYLATMLAHLHEHELGIRLLHDGAARAPRRGTRGRLGALHGVLLAELGRTAQARTRLEEALADAAGEAAEAARIHSAPAVVSADTGAVERSLPLIGHAEALDTPEPGTAFAHAFARLQVALLREDADAATESGHALDRAGDELLGRLPDHHPDALAAVADLAYARFRIAALAGHADRLARPASVLRIATRALAAALGAENPRTITARVRQAECDRLLGGARPSDVRAKAARRFGPEHPLAVAAGAANPDGSGADAAARVLGRHRPLTVVLTAATRPEGDTLARTAAQAALVLGVGHSVTRMLDERLRSCRRTGPNTTPTHPSHHRRHRDRHHCHERADRRSDRCHRDRIHRHRPDPDRRRENSTARRRGRGGPTGGRRATGECHRRR
jgi:hypothetical protein